MEYEKNLVDAIEVEEVEEEEEETVTCFGCNEDIRIEEAFEIGDEHFCEMCHTDYDVCRECGEVHARDGMRYDSYNENYMCESCYDDGYYTCEDCGEITDEIIMVNDDSFVCEGCSDNYYKCMDCGTYHTYSKITLENNGEYICEDCSDSWYQCNDCGALLGESDYYSTDDAIYCESCYDDHRENDGGIHDYSYKPSPNFYYIDDENEADYTYKENLNTMYLGVELEVDNGYSKGEMVTNIHDNMEWIYCKEDGSLDDGIELVTHPCTLEYHLQAEYESCFDELVSNGWRGHDAESCGLHVHVNKRYLGNSVSEQELTIAKIMLIMDRLWDCGLVEFTRRTEYQLNKWAKRCTIEERGEEVSEDKAREKTKEYFQMGRYFALNLRNSETIEFRLFRSTLKIGTFKATLQFVSNLVNFAMSTTLADIQSMGLKMSDIINFEEYEELKEYAISRNLIQ